MINGIHKNSYLISIKDRGQKIDSGVLSLEWI